MNYVRALFHAEVDGLLSDLARMTRLTGQMMTHASSCCTRLIARSLPSSSLNVTS